MSVSAKSGAPAARKPAEARRWLKRRVPREHLYRLAPVRPKPRRLGTLDFTDRLRRLARAWWAWFILFLGFYLEQWWTLAIAAGIVSFVLYHTSAESHPAVYPLESRPDIESEQFHVTMAGLTGMPLIPGNSVEIYNNGDEFYPAMLDAIESAQRTVTMEQYIFWDGEVGRRFAEAFAEVARRGVAVKLLLDAIGSATLGREIFRILEAGGCQLAWFRPIHWYTLHRANLRNHRKSLIVDGSSGFTGGAGLADHWLGSASDAAEWRDIQVKVRGPAVRALQTGFVQNWLITTGEILSGAAYFPEVAPAGDLDVQMILSSPFAGGGAVGTMYLVALQSAKRYLYIANPYFIPDPRVIEMLASATRRGVTVKLMVAGGHNDTWWARQNSVRLYGKLLKAGVELYEFEPAMLHQKTMIVDGIWATVGTANFDNRSFALSEESNLCFHDAALVTRMCAIFEADLARSRRVQLDAWRRRGGWQMLQEEVAALIEDQV